MLFDEVSLGLALSSASSTLSDKYVVRPPVVLTIAYRSPGVRPKTDVGPEADVGRLSYKDPCLLGTLKGAGTDIGCYIPTRSHPLEWTPQRRCYYTD
ncbi:hypothetical protein K432DRAFT_382830 [Lepidopterella palustris CBS 459.81]|uniref:Uncharacterized protein n=1 Tax=Lepidopterella palustris CBS 459.81 TaxID=1314670 RepID=A0A8E2JF58_9PEZI|nr:hypothetical protein K432DRAFT_382830 [Lepidopterella palustris CBS 459.81]